MCMHVQYIFSRTLFTCTLYCTCMCAVCARAVITSILQSRLEFYLPAHHYSVVVLSLCNHLVYVTQATLYMYVGFVDGSNVHCFHCAFIVYGQLVIRRDGSSIRVHPCTCTCICIYRLHIYMYRTVCIHEVRVELY